MSNRFRIILLTSLSAAAMATASYAEEAPPARDDKPVEVIITGTGYRVTKDSLMSHVDVLTRADIDQKPAQGVGDMLAYLPGIRSSSFAPGASRPMIRGLDGFRVLVLNDGMGAVDVSALSPDHAIPTSPTEAKRIEVLRGPSALAYGGNAIGGIVNIIDDRIPVAVAKDGLEGTVAVQGSSVDSGRQGAFNVKAGNGPWVATFDTYKLITEDYSVPVPPQTLAFSTAAGEAPDTATKQHNSAEDMRNVGAGVSYIADRGYAGLSYKKTDYLYGTAIDSDVLIDMHQTRWDARGALNLNWAGFTRLDAAAGTSNYRHAEVEDGAIGTQFFSKGTEFRAALVREGAGKISGTVGVSMLKRDFRALGDEAFVPSTTNEQSGVFAQYRYDAGKWGVEGGGRLDSTTLTSTEAGFARDFATSSASLGGFYRPADHTFLGLSLTRSERAPSEVELLAEGPHAGTGQFIIGNRNFVTEVGTSLELTGHWTIDADNRFQVDAHVYTSHFDNFIDLRTTGAFQDGLPVFQYVQTNADLYGVELETGTKLFDWGKQAVSLHGSYDYTHGQSQIGPVIRISPQAVTVKLESRDATWDSYVEVRGVDARKTRLAAFETPTDGYVTVNVFTSYKLASAPGVAVFAEVRNLGDVEMREATSATKDAVVGPGRNMRVGLTYNF